MARVARDVKQTHALEFFAPAIPPAQFVEERAAHSLSAAIGNTHRQTLVPIENE